jgi:hypothetical protein
VYKLGKNWQTRAWHPVFKTAGSAHNATMIHGLFSQKNLKITIKEKLHTNGFMSILQEEFLPCPVHPTLFHNFGCCYIILMGHKKIKIKNINNGDEQIFYDYSEINQKGPPVRKT